jgi:hypothetical protein
MASRLAFNDNVDIMGACRLLLKSGASDLLIEDTGVLEGTNAPISLFRCIQQEMYPPFSDLPLRNCLNVLAPQFKIRWHNIPILLQSSFVSGSGIEPEALNWVNESHQSLLHLFAENFAALFFFISLMRLKPHSMIFLIRNSLSSCVPLTGASYGVGSSETLFALGLRCTPSINGARHPFGRFYGPPPSGQLQTSLRLRKCG